MSNLQAEYGVATITVKCNTMVASRLGDMVAQNFYDFRLYKSTNSLPHHPLECPDQ